MIEMNDETEPNFEYFDTAINNLNGYINKKNNKKNICKNKIIVIGRAGSMKHELILYLIKLKLSPDSLSKLKNKYIEYISENNNYGILVDDKTERIEFESDDSLDEYIKSNYSTFSTQIKIFYPRSGNEVLKDKIVMDTPFYNYSDERDDEIVDYCRDGPIFIVVLNAVGSIGDQDKKIFKRLNEINFIKLIFIFNRMEQFLKGNYPRTKGQHEANATRISNEILKPAQEIIPIYFVENCQMDKNDLQKSLADIDSTERHIEEYITNEIKPTKERIINEKSQIMKTLKKKKIEFNEYKKNNEENTINEQKNKQMEKLKELIEEVDCLENKITHNSENLEDIIKIYKELCEKFNENKSGFSASLYGNNEKNKIKNSLNEEITDITFLNKIEGKSSNTEDTAKFEKYINVSENLENVIKETVDTSINPANDKVEIKNSLNKEIGSDDDRRLVDEQSANTDDNKMSVNNEENEILKKQLDNIVENLKKLRRTLNDYNKSLGKTPIDNNGGKNPDQNESEDQSIISKKNINKINEEMSEYIENKLNDIEINIEDFNKYSSEYRSFLTEYFQYILHMLYYMNNIVWTGDLTKYSLKETSTFPAIPDKLIEEINFIEIESFNVLLIFLLLIKIFIAKIIEVKENKYSAFHSKSLVTNNITTTLLRCYIKWIGLFTTDHHKENMAILNNNLTNTKLFDKFKQIKLIKCERNTKYCKSESDSLKTIILENENKLNILNEAEEKINNLMEELEKNI